MIELLFEDCFRTREPIIARIYRALTGKKKKKKSKANGSHAPSQQTTTQQAPSQQPQSGMDETGAGVAEDGQEGAY